jgi:hypothetical protein
MTTQTEKLLGLLIAIFATLLLLIVYSSDLMSKRAYGSVSVTDEYQATSTRNAFDGTPNGGISTGKVLCTGPCTLGSIVITGADVGVIEFYDATSTAQHTDYATTTLVSISASTAAGTYTFDLQASRGLLYRVVGTAPTTTITFRK